MDTHNENRSKNNLLQETFRLGDKNFYNAPNSMNFNISLPFYNNAIQNPKRLALSVNGLDFSYGELAVRAGRISGWLQQISPGDVKRVGILASRSWVAYTGILGAAWAGAAYVPLHPDWPEQRLLKILATAELDSLVVDERGLKCLSSEVLRLSPKGILAPDSASSFQLGTPPMGRVIVGFDGLPATDPRQVPKTVGEEDLAYIMFTSGTTGAPKGVMITGGNVHFFVSAMLKRFPFDASDRVSQVYEITFDGSVLDLFTTWHSGASLHVVPASQLMGPSRFIREKGLTMYFSVPSMVATMQTMKMLTPSAFPSVRYSIFGAEPLSASTVEAWQRAVPNSVVENLYGPTEATCVCIGQRCSAPLVITEGRGTMAIGEPFDGMEAAILDSSLRFLPAGKRASWPFRAGK